MKKVHSFPKDLCERYTPKKVIGEGAWSTVWLAELKEPTSFTQREPASSQRKPASSQTELARKEVAIKVLRNLGTGQNVEKQRFELECELAGAAIHPALVKIIEGKEDKGHRYLVTEYIRGQTLKSILARKRPQPIKQTLIWALELANCLAALHQRSIVHRDVKPANIMIDDGKRLRLLDLGLARQLDEVGPTKTGVIVGTPDFIAPEICRGEKAAPAVDVFALGLVILNCLSKKNPLSAEASLQEILFNRATGKEKFSFPLNIPQSIVTLLKGFLENDPTLRTPDCFIASKVLNQVLENYDEGNTHQEANEKTRLLKDLPLDGTKKTQEISANKDENAFFYHKRSKRTWFALAVFALFLCVLGYRETMGNSTIGRSMKAANFNARYSHREKINENNEIRKQQRLDKFTVELKSFIKDKNKRRATGHPVVSAAKGIDNIHLYQKIAYGLAHLNLPLSVKEVPNEKALKFAADRFVPILDLVFRLPRPQNHLEHRAAAEMVWDLVHYSARIRLHSENNLKLYAKKQTTSFSEAKNMTNALQRFAVGMDKRTDKVTHLRALIELKQLCKEFSDERLLVGAFELVLLRLETESHKAADAEKRLQSLYAEQNNKEKWPFLSLEYTDNFLSSAKKHQRYWQGKWTEMDRLFKAEKIPSVPWTKAGERPPLEWRIWRADNIMHLRTYASPKVPVSRNKAGLVRAEELFDSIKHIGSAADRYFRDETLYLFEAYADEETANRWRKKYPKTIKRYVRIYRPWPKPRQHKQ